MSRAATVPTPTIDKNGKSTTVHRRVDAPETAPNLRLTNVALVPSVSSSSSDEPDTGAEFDTVINALEARQDKKMTQDQICDFINDLDISAESMVTATDFIQGKFISAFGDDPEGDPKVQIRSLLPALRKFRNGMDDDL